MKRIIILLFVWMGAIGTSLATDRYQQQLTPEEFRAKMQAFITERAGLTSEEANRFFPVYFELQTKKREVNDKMWKLMHAGAKEQQLTDKQYDEMLIEIYDLRIRSSQLEKEYYTKFKEVLTPKKIYNVQRAETKFHRELVRGVNRENKGKGKK